MNKWQEREARTRARALASLDARAQTLRDRIATYERDAEDDRVASLLVSTRAELLEVERVLNVKREQWASEGRADPAGVARRKLERIAQLTRELESLGVRVNVSADDDDDDDAGDDEQEGS